MRLVYLNTREDLEEGVEVHLFPGLWVVRDGCEWQILFGWLWSFVGIAWGGGCGWHGFG